MLNKNGLEKFMFRVFAATFLLVGGLVMTGAQSADLAIGRNQTDMRDKQQDAAIDDLRLRVAALERASRESVSNLSEPSAIYPNTDDGKPLMQLNIGRWSHNFHEEPFINHGRAMGDGWHATGDNVPPLEMKDLYVMGHIDRETLMPSSLPPGYTKLSTTKFRRPAKQDSEGWAGKWIVEWKGAKSAKILNAGWRTARETAPGRIEFTIADNDRSVTNVEFTGIEEGGITEFKFYRAENETALKEGRIFSPRFIDYVSRYKILRALDTQGVVVSGVTKAGQHTPYSSKNWGFGPALNESGLPMGPPLQALFDLAVESDTALWMLAPPGLGAEGTGWNEAQYNGPRRGDIKTIAMANAEKILTSDEWDKYADEIVAAMIASGYPENRMLYIELGNEIWNTAHPFWWMTVYFDGLSGWIQTTKKDVKGFGAKVGNGYATGRLAAAIDGALARAGRTQAVTFVLASQNANIGTSFGVVNGYKLYFEANNIDPAPYLSRAGVSTAPYFHGAFDRKRGPIRAADNSSYEKALMERINADPEGFAEELADWIITHPGKWAMPWTFNRRAQAQSIAENAGMKFIGDYEGGTHDKAPAGLRHDKVFLKWYYDVFLDGPAGERIAREWVTQSLAQNPDAIVSNYGTLGPRDVLRPWNDGFYGMNTGRNRGLEPYLRDPE